MIGRTLFSVISKRIDFTKAIQITGPRQVGKTTLIRVLTSSIDAKYLYVNGDDPAQQLLWNNATEALLKQLVAGRKVVVIDEAQRIENIGLAAKMLIDASLGIQLMLSGSSAIGLNDTIVEPLTGRKWEFNLYPLSWSEMVEHFGLAAMLQRLPQLLVTGCYPEVINNEGNEKAVLASLAGSYLYKDVLELGNIRKPHQLTALLQALAWQVGNEVSYNELSNTLGIDKATVANYMDLLEKSFVIFRLNPLSRNLRNEISTSRKIYFYDNGVRNSIIGNYAPIEGRNDIGQLWENFLVSERKKKLAYQPFFGNTFFWRTKQQAEIDYIEEENGLFKAYEFKWSPNAKARISSSFVNAYQPIETKILTRDNFYDWLR